MALSAGRYGAHRIGGAAEDHHCRTNQKLHQRIRRGTDGPNAEAALTKVCKTLDCEISNYTAAPVYASDHSRGRHEWLIEFNREPESIDEFARQLDLALQQENSDYEAKRSHGIFLDRLTIVKGRKGVFDKWLAATGKLGGQRKVPRLSNSRHPIDEILKFN